MNFLQRILSPFLPPTPDCGHETEIHQLRNEVQAARLARQLQERANVQLTRENALLLSSAESEANAAKIRLAQIERLESELEESRRDLAARRSELLEAWDARDTAQQQARDLAIALEEEQSAVAVLQARVRELGGNVEQLPLTAGGDVEPPSEVPEGEDKEIANQVLELVFRLVGVFFDDGPGRRHSWIMERGAERVKVPIVDKAFIERVAKREFSFGAGDTLVGDFHVITWLRTNGDVDVEYRTCDVVKRVISPDVQTEIPMEAAHV